MLAPQVELEIRSNRAATCRRGQVCLHRHPGRMAGCRLATTSGHKDRPPRRPEQVAPRKQTSRLAEAPNGPAHKARSGNSEDN